MSQRPLVLGGNSRLPTVRRHKEQPAAPLLFRCFPLFLYRSHGPARSSGSGSSTTTSTLRLSTQDHDCRAEKFGLRQCRPLVLIQQSCYFVNEPGGNRTVCRWGSAPTK